MSSERHTSASRTWSLGHLNLPPLSLQGALNHPQGLVDCFAFREEHGQPQFNYPFWSLMFGYLGNSASFPQILLGHGSTGKLVLPGWAWRGLLSPVPPADSGGSRWRQAGPQISLVWVCCGRGRPLARVLALRLACALAESFRGLCGSSLASGLTQDCSVPCCRPLKKGSWSSEPGKKVPKTWGANA